MGEGPSCRVEGEPSPMETSLLPVEDVHLKTTPFNAGDMVFASTTSVRLAIGGQSSNACWRMGTNRQTDGNYLIK